MFFSFTLMFTNLHSMESKILKTIKPLKNCANFFGFIPLCLNKNDKNFKTFLYISYAYSAILVAIMSFTLYYVTFYLMEEFEDISLMPGMVQKAIEMLFVFVSILQTGGIFFHSRAMTDIFENFCKIDSKVD